MMMVRPLLTILALVSLFLVLSSKPHEASRVRALREDEEIWMRNKYYLFLPSKENMKKKLQVLLPSLWKPVTPPTPNPGHNSYSPLGEKSFARGSLGRMMMRKKHYHLLLPSLQWRPVSSPSSNPGHNKVSEKNFAGKKGVACISAPKATS